jgi:ABC-type nitrate/sulfonate/bicarbonate transport system substrate-binding protein
MLFAKLRWAVFGLVVPALLAAAPKASADELTKVKIALPVMALVMAPVLYARDAGLYRKEGIEVELPVFRGGPPADAALLSGDAQFLAADPYEFLKVADSGREVRILTLVSSLTTELIASNQFVHGHGITAGMTPKERLAHAKGMRLGLVALGGTGEGIARWLVKYGGLDFDRDVQKIQIGGLPQLLGAMKAGRIDGFVLSPPAGGLVKRLGIGEVLIEFNEIPDLKGVLLTGLQTRPDYIAAHGPVVERVVKATVEAMDEIVKRPEEVARRLKEGSFAQSQLDDLVAALKLMADTFRPEPMSDAQWRRTQEFYRAAIGDTTITTVKLVEGKQWTNRFLDAARKP